MSNNFKYKDGRVWIQTKKFESYKLLLPYGLTGVTDPLGNLNAVREPSPEKRGLSIIADIIRGEPGLPQFSIETRLQRTLNYLFGMRKCATNFQGHLGKCDRPDNYFASAVVMHWERAHRGDLGVDRLSLIEGDDGVIQMTAPYVAEVGPLLFDLEAEFLSQRTIADTEDGTAVAFLGDECLEDCRSQEGAGENGYLSSGLLGGSAGNVANVWYTEDYGENWTVTTSPFAAAMAISDILAIGTKRNHRVIVANGTTRASDPAQIAYADITDMGTTTWVTVDVGAVDGQYITDLLFIDWRNVFASTDDGYIYKSDDGGATWTAVYTAGAVDINRMAGLSKGIIWAVGNSDLILYSSDFGVSWSVIDGPLTAAADATAVLVTPDETVFVGYSTGAVYGSVDNGDEWQILALQGVVPTAVTDIKASGDSNIFVSVNIADGSGRVLRSIDGGANFRLWNLNTPTNAGLARLSVIDDNTVWVVGDAYGGSTFVTRTNSRLIGL